MNDERMTWGELFGMGYGVTLIFEGTGARMLVTCPRCGERWNVSSEPDAELLRLHREAHDGPAH